MAAKVVWYREAWWLRVHYRGRKRDKKFGPTKADKSRATSVAAKVNARIELGHFGLERPRTAKKSLMSEIRAWHADYRATMKPSYAKLTMGLIENHLDPAFSGLAVADASESELRRFVDK